MTIKVQAVKTELQMALGSVYRIRMGRGIDQLPSEEWAMRLHGVEAELVKLREEFDKWQKEEKS